MVFLILGLVLIFGSAIFALVNMGHMFRSGMNGNLDGVDGSIVRHIAAAVGGVVGLALFVVGILVLIL